MESEIQLTAIQQNRSGGASGTSCDKKRASQEEVERETSQLPPFKKFKPNQQSQSFKPRQSGGQSSSSSRPAGTQFMRPVPGQGLICFKCGKPHHSSECTFFLELVALVARMDTWLLFAREILILLSSGRNLIPLPPRLQLVPEVQLLLLVFLMVQFI